MDEANEDKKTVKIYWKNSESSQKTFPIAYSDRGLYYFSIQFTETKVQKNKARSIFKVTEF